MQNGLSPSTYLFPTPQAPSHAHYTHQSFSLRSPPHDHPTYLHSHSGPSTCSASAPSAPATQTGYPYASPSIDPLVSYPAPVSNYGAHHLKTHPASATWPPPPPTMAISVTHYNRPHPALSTSGSSSHNGGEDSSSGSDGGREPTPPPAARQRAKDAKKKVHACMMCHKSFDRPSTLKKHLLVHTGEKAFACESCGRRFGVASNLNRHAKTCRVALAAPSASSDSGTPAAGTDSRGTSTSQATSADSSADTASSTTATPTVLRRLSRKRRNDGEEESCPPDPTTERRQQQPRSRKRARRAPTPERWIPDSLKTFDLTPIAKSTPVPLPPVRPFQDSYNHVFEERDSYDENASANPYHPRGWKGRLPGPGLMGNNVANRSGGQLLIF